MAMEISDLLACRACLSTDTKLIGIHEFALDGSFQNVFGTAVVPDDSFPQYLCHYCCGMLFKVEAFLQRFQKAQDILTTIMIQQQSVTTEALRNLDRYDLNLALPLTAHIVPESSIIKAVHVAPIRLNLSKLPRIKIIPQSMASSLKVGEAETTYTLETNNQLFQVVDYGKQNGELSFKQVRNPDEDPNCINDRYKNISQHPNVEVVILSLEEQIDEHENKKKSIGYSSAFLKCEFCYKGFLKESSYNAHMVMHDPLYGQFECPVCKIRCETRAKLRLHSRMNHERRFVCKLCGHIDTQSMNAKRHQQFHDGIRHDCPFCGNTFSKASTLTSHIRVHHPSTRVCEVCGEQVHGEICPCQRETASSRHCNDCQIEFDTLTAYNTHLTTSAVHSESDSNLWEHCKHCGESFACIEELNEHVNSNHEQTVQCELCDMTLSSARGLAIHTGACHKGRRGGGGELHYPTRRYICQYCGDELPSGELLNEHKLTHSGDKPFQCNHCERGFRHPQLLQVHMRTHTGEMPYQCDSCFRCFSHKANLNRHQKVHTGEKPYVCAVCNKCFSQSNSLKLHIKTVHLKQPAPYRSRKRRSKKTEESRDVDECDE